MFGLHRSGLSNRQRELICRLRIRGSRLTPKRLARHSNLRAVARPFFERIALFLRDLHHSPLFPARSCRCHCYDEAEDSMSHLYRRHLVWVRYSERGAILLDFMPEIREEDMQKLALGLGRFAALEWHVGHEIFELPQFFLGLIHSRIIQRHGQLIGSSWLIFVPLFPAGGGWWRFLFVIPSGPWDNEFDESPGDCWQIAYSRK